MEKKITGELLGAMRPEINKALEAVGKKYGVTLEAGNASYTDLDATFKLIVKVAATADFNPEKEIWDRYCKLVGLQPEDFGKTFTDRGVTYEICGYNPKATSNRIKIRDIRSGKEYVCPPSFVKINCSTQVPPEKEGSSLMDPAEWRSAILFSRLQEDDLGKEIRLNGELFCISGFNRKARVNKVLVKRKKDNKEFGTTIPAVLEALGRPISSN